MTSSSEPRTHGTPVDGAPNTDVTPPPCLQAGQHSWVLQTVMDLQKTVGKLTGTVEGLTGTVAEQSRRIDALGGKIDGCRNDLTRVLASVRTAYRILAVVISVFGALIAFALYRLPAIVEGLPAIIEALRAGGPGGGS